MGTGSMSRPAPAVPGRVPFKQLPRKTSHRTSAPTNQAIRIAMAEVSRNRATSAGRDPATDAVILAALRIATRDAGGGKRPDYRELLAEVARIEAEEFEVRPGGVGGHDPGDPGGEE